MQESNLNSPLTAEDYLNIAVKATGATVLKPMEALQNEVNELVKQVTVSEDGKFIYPEGTPEHLRLAVATEKKFRDTQSGFTKSQTRLKQVEEENKALLEKLAQLSTSQGLAQEDLDRLEDLKYEDPEKWYSERQKLEGNAAAQHSQAMAKEQEIRNRERYLAEISVGREVPITAEVLENDVPPRLNKKLINGELSFEDYISEVVKYLDKGKVVFNPTPTVDTILDGGTSARTGTKAQQPELDYSKITF